MELSYMQAQILTVEGEKLATPLWNEDDEVTEGLFYEYDDGDMDMLDYYMSVAHRSAYLGLTKFD